MVIHDEKGNAVTEFPEVSGERVIPFVDVSGFNIGAYDTVSVFYPNNAIQEIYTFKLDGATVATVDVVYTDTTKDFLLRVTKT